MIKAIIFDFGGVILRTVDREPRHAWDRRLGLEPGSVEHLVFNSERGLAAQRGETTEADHWRWLVEHLELDEADAADFQQSFWAGDRLDQQLIALIQGMRRNYQTALISNAMDDLRASLKQSYGIFDLFDVVVISSEFGVMKPDAAIFEHCLTLLDVQANEAVFVDDFAHNIAGAQAVGMHTVHYTPNMNSDDLRAALHSLGVELGSDSNL